MIHRFCNIRPRRRHFLPAVFLAVFVLLSLATLRAEEPVCSYVARLSQQDHFASDGVRLTSVSDILRQDRANLHRFHHPDPEDESDPVFSNIRNRSFFDQLSFSGPRQALARGLILKSTPLVRVTVFQNRVSVTILED